MPRKAFRLVWFIWLAVAACSPLRGLPENAGSVGSTDNGYLVGGIQLPSNDDLVVLEPEKAWGTPELVHLLEAVAADMHLAYPDAPPLVVGHLSQREGGSLSPHRSHQSGRDADVAMYAADNKLHRRFLDMTSAELDVPKTWALIDTLQTKGRIQYILLDWEVQQRIYEEISLFEPEQRLASLFQYPRPRRTRAGIVRHASGHCNHLHVRIHCPEQDTHCIE